MKLYMKQRVFSFTQDFDIYDEHRQPVYNVRGELLSIGRRLRIFDNQTNEEVALIREKVLTFMPKFDVYVRNSYITSIKQRFTFFRPKYDISQLGWHLEGDVFAHDYTVYNSKNQPIARIYKKFFSWSDSFEIDIQDLSVDPVHVVAIVLAIDAVMDKAQRSKHRSHNHQT